ncbi:hypothetical protein SUGI_0746050 [Cryptomeria japonica]|nr:hypothetical protein SUGI_0746050 [Cryptomeria japonica]
MKYLEEKGIYWHVCGGTKATNIQSCSITQKPVPTLPTATCTTKSQPTRGAGMEEQSYLDNLRLSSLSNSTMKTRGWREERKCFCFGVW